MFGIIKLIKRLLCWTKYSNPLGHSKIPTYLNNIGCYTLEDMAELITHGFYDYTNNNVKLAINHFKNYLDTHFSDKIGDKIMISLPHKSDPWCALSSTGKYLVASHMSKNFCHSRWLIQIQENEINFIQKFDTNIYVPDRLIFDPNFILENPV